ncbi:MAG: CRISPR-associated endonuclease Cas3'', partial [Abitibacteriaceae bacterium]|nr:CRISPR-associated endonuclease Cas3'' [Abditibacteriaceae bacterium]
MTSIAYKLWAKSDPYHPLWCHLLDVAAVAKALLPRFGPLEEMPTEWACYLCALHDIGKADPWFQNKDATLAEALAQLGLKLPERLDTTSSSMLRFRHEARSQGWLLDYLPAQHGWGKSAARVAVHAINGHHGNFGADCYKESDWPVQYATWNPMREQLAQLVWDALQPPPYAPQKFDHAGALGVTLSGLIILADWIASNDSVYPYSDLHGHDDPKAYFAAAQAQARAVVHKMKLDTPAARQLAPQPRFGDVWPDLADSPRPSQSALESEVLAGRAMPGLAIIEAQMGEGKTEGAIYLSECWNAQRGVQGIYFGLPTQATSNQMHGRYAKYLRVRRPGASPRLVHGMAWLVDDVAPATTAQTYGDTED